MTRVLVRTMVQHMIGFPHHLHEAQNQWIPHNFTIHRKAWIPLSKLGVVSTQSYGAPTMIVIQCDIHLGS